MKDVVEHILKDKELTFKIDVVVFVTLVGLHASNSPWLQHPLVRVLAVLLVSQQIYSNFIQQTTPVPNEEEVATVESVPDTTPDVNTNYETTPDDISNKWFVTSTSSSRTTKTAPHDSKVDFWSTVVGTTPVRSRLPLCTRSYSSLS